MEQRQTTWKEEGHVFTFQQMDNWEDGTQYLTARFVDGGSVVSGRNTVSEEGRTTQGGQLNDGHD